MKTILETMDFGNEAGDDVQGQDLAPYFVEQRLFKQFTSPEKRILVATAKKGVGKSALIQWISYRIPKTDHDVLVIKLRGADITRTKFGLSNPLETPNDYIQDWMVRLCTIVNRQLALRLRLALADDSITLIEAAEIDGYRSRNLVRCLIDRFEKLIPKLNAPKQQISNELEILKRAKPQNVWILIDDLDATFQNTSRECLELSAFFSACRYLLQDIQGLTIRATMRTDVWPIIRRFDEALDKMKQYIRDIKWSEDDFRSLLARRIRHQLAVQSIKYKEPPAHVHIQDRERGLIERVFVPRMPWGEEGRENYTYRVIYTLSYRRPRWAIQLCKLAQEDAYQHKEKKIGRNNIDNVWGEYGIQRIEDLVSEHKHQIREIEELINSFRGAPRLMPREELMRWINNRVLTHLAPKIEGEKVSSPLQIAQFLYRIGFLQARSQEPGGNYEHYDFDDMPDFLASRTNEDFGVSWEIHPCYREALDIEKLDRAKRIKMGLIRDRSKK